MSFKNPKSLILVVSAVAALMAATVLLGGYAGSNAAATDSEAPVKACKASGDMAGCPMMAAQSESTGCSEKPCCSEKPAEGCCEKPCAEDCEKPCCAEKPAEGCCGTAGATGCPMTAAKTAAQ